MKCGWFLIAGALIAPVTSFADVTYTFDFSSSNLTSGQRVPISYTAPSPTPPRQTAISRATRSQPSNRVVSGFRTSNGAWIFTDSSDPGSRLTFTAQTDLKFANLPGTYANIPASTFLSCGAGCSGHEPGASTGSVTITIANAVTNKAAVS